MNRRSVLRWIGTPLLSGIARAARLAAGSMPWLPAGGGNSNTVVHRLLGRVREMVGKDQACVAGPGAVPPLRWGKFLGHDVQVVEAPPPLSPSPFLLSMRQYWLPGRFVGDRNGA
jgi:hypothetical protein